MLRITRGSAATIRTSFIADGIATESDDPVLVSVTDAAGVVVASGTATFEAADVAYAFTIGSAVTDTLGLLSVEWAGTFTTATATVRDDYEVVGARLATVSEVRELADLADVETFPTEQVQEAIVVAEDVVAAYCGTMFVERAASMSFRCRGASRFLLDHIFPVSIVSATADGVAVDTADWILREWGDVEGVYGLSGEVRITYTHGATPAPSEIRWAARTLARQYLLDRVSRVPDRALSIQSDYGQISLAQAGAKGRPTSLPDVNAALNRHHHRL